MLLYVNNMVCIIRVCVPVYATTAANPDESSYACYYDEARDTYLGDWYSVNWMEDSDVVGTRIWDIESGITLLVGRCFKWCCVFVSLGGSEQRDFGQAV